MRALAFVLACLLVLVGAENDSGRKSSTPSWPHVWPKEATAGKTGGASGDSANDGTRPLFCKGLDCPHFDVVETLPNNVELRRYHGKTRWVATRVRDTTFFDAQIIGTKRLIAYFAGWNEERLFLRPTLPLVTALFPADRRSRSVKGTYILMAYIPEDRQDRPPCPSDPDVHVLTFRGAREFFVQTVDGFLDSDEVVRRGWDLIERLRDDHRCVTRCVFGFSLYDPPTKLLFRHNEIWVPARRRCSRGDGPGGDSGDAPDEEEWDDGAWPEQDSYDGECSAEDIQPDQPPSS